MESVDLLDWLALPLRPLKRRCRVPADLDAVTARAPEAPAKEVGVAQAGVERIWERVESLYRTGLYPAIQLCVRRHGAVILDRAVGYATGNAPDASAEGAKRLVTTDTPFRIYSASKAVTAMVVHLLDDRGVLHIDDRLADYLPEFDHGARSHITIAHVLCHRAGIPNVPPGAMDLALLEDPERLVAILAETPLVARPGRRLAYHAVTGGFLLAEVVRRAAGRDIRAVLDSEIRHPMGLRWLSYGVAPEDIAAVAEDAQTGLPALPPLGWMLTRALGAPVPRVMELAHDPRFLTGILPSANVVSNAHDLGAFFECLRQDGRFEGIQVFEPRTVRRATAEQSYWEVDLTLGMPLRYGLGFMLGGKVFSLFGPDTPHAFGHLGFTNVIGWADPDRALSAALVTNGKPLINIEAVRLYQVLMAIGRELPRVSGA
jgi:CubicO group peptidase (beta-lactamase class C family)